MGKLTIRDLIQNKKDHSISEKKELPDSVRAIRHRVKLQAITMLATVALVLVLVFAMTAAWYTNVAKTSDLTFQTEVWGFDESKITLPEETDVILAAPGTGGMIPLTIDNSGSTDGVKISVMISKLSMDEELKKRIFFYADTPMMQTFETDGTEADASTAGDGTTDTSAADDGSAYANAAGDAVTASAVGTREMMNRVYIGATESNNYTYTILPGQKLLLSESCYNDVPLKWEWVYDMVGYYFVGKVDATLQAGAAGSVVADEYLRPISYDYSEAIFDVQETIVTPETAGTENEVEITNVNYGQLLSIGRKTREEFLQEISAADGYQGVIDTENPVILIADTTNAAGGADGSDAADTTDGTDTTGSAVTIGEPQRLYYPIDVDDSGYGVWAYLCTRNEIKEAIVYDTALQSAQEKVQAKANIVLTSVNVPTVAQAVEDSDALITALTGTDVDTVELTTDITLDGPVAVAGSESKMVNLNGYTISYTGLPAEGETETQMFVLEDGASLMLLNGSLDCGSDPLATAGTIGNAAVESVGGELVLSGVTVTGFDTIVNIKDMEGVPEDSGDSTDGEQTEETTKQPLDSTVKITNCTMEAAQIGIRLQGNGDASDALTKLIIQDSTLTCGYMGISGQGNADRSGTELMIINSRIDGYYAALYHPQQNSKVVITDGSEMVGYTAVIMKGGTLTLENSTVRGTGAYAPAKATRSGFTDTGDGVYVEAVYDWSTTVILKGENQITSDNAYAVDLFGETGKGLGKVLIYGGAHNGTKGSALFNGIGIFEIYGGTYNMEPESSGERTIVRYDQAVE